MLSPLNRKLVLLLVIVTTMMPLHTLRAAISAQAVPADAAAVQQPSHDMAAMQASGCQMHQGSATDSQYGSACGGAGCDMCGVCAVGPLSGGLQPVAVRTAFFNYDTVTQRFPQALPATHFRPPRT